MTKELNHETVLLQQAVDALLVDSAGNYFDCTFGRGGHSRQILSNLDTSGNLFALDRDPDAVKVGAALASKDQRLEVHYGNYTALKVIAWLHSVSGNVSGVLFDLGVSSPQLDDSSRGFSFMRDGPLDMRMDTTTGQTASEWINLAMEAEIADVLWRYGEERFSRRMAKAVVKARAKRPITTTGQLAEIFKQANPAWEKDKHPATRAFQAIRIFINNELDALSEALEQALDVLSVGGRLVVISFHSLEDKIVKKFISLQTKGDNFPRGVPVRYSELNPRLKIIGKPVRVSAAEIKLNPRSRSAVLRVAEKIA